MAASSASNIPSVGGSSPPQSNAVLLLKDSQVLLDVAFSVFAFCIKIYGIGAVPVGITSLSIFATKGILKAVELKLDKLPKNEVDKAEDILFVITTIAQLTLSTFILTGKDNALLFSGINLGLIYGSKIITVITKRARGKPDDRYSCFLHPTSTEMVREQDAKKQQLLDHTAAKSDGAAVAPASRPPSNNGYLMAKDAQLLLDVAFAILLFCVKAYGIGKVPVGVVSLSVCTTKMIAKVVEMKLNRKVKNGADKAEETLFWITTVAEMTLSSLVLAGKEDLLLFTAISLGVSSGIKVITQEFKRVMGKEDDLLSPFRAAAISARRASAAPVPSNAATVPSAASY